MVATSRSSLSNRWRPQALLQSYNVPGTYLLGRRISPSSPPSRYRPVHFLYNFQCVVITNFIVSIFSSSVSCSSLSSSISCLAIIWLGEIFIIRISVSVVITAAIQIFRCGLSLFRLESLRFTIIPSFKWMVRSVMAASPSSWSRWRTSGRICLKVEEQLMQFRFILGVQTAARFIGKYHGRVIDWCPCHCYRCFSPPESSLLLVVGSVAQSHEFKQILRPFLSFFVAYAIDVGLGIMMFSKAVNSGNNWWNWKTDPICWLRNSLSFFFFFWIPKRERRYRPPR